MRPTRLLRITLAVCLFAAAASTAGAQEPNDAPEAITLPSYPLMRATLAAQSGALRTSVAYDTTYLGHSHADHTAGGSNPWNIYVGTCRPSVNRADNALWDFENQAGLGSGDSLQGWWPMTTPYRYAPISTMTDDKRPWFLLDYGNQLNYRPINGRTYGVVSAWHADPGNAAGHVMWAPISGTKSMWCGLRALNDNSVIDPVTHQPYNEQAVQFNTWGSNTSAAPIYRNYPGYGNQWDQILYRDFAVPSGQPMSIAFLYRTRLSTSFSTGVTTRTGWFHGDPLAMTTGNFISANAAGANAPRDSFSVYIGAPVDDASVTLSDASVSGHPVFDKQRRWFNEVLRLDAPRFEILGAAGSNPADTLSPAVAVNQTIPWSDPGNGNAYVSAIWNAAGNTNHLVRLVFRVKTNRTYSDDDYKSGSGVVNGNYTSSGRGAALIDDVVVNGMTSDFEGANGGVDNALDGAGNWVTSTLDSWKSTGKPLPQYCHAENILTETHWSDLCGPPHTPYSTCNLDGAVVSIGNADQNGSIADPRWPAFTEALYGIMSPTINLVTSGPNTPNGMGLTGNMVAATYDICLQYELNYAAFVLANTGTMWYWGVQCYPALTANGHMAWSDFTGGPFWYYQTYPGCGLDFEVFKGNSVLHTSNANGIPDSLRVYLGLRSECFYFGGSCNSTAGGYFDDISVAFVNNVAATPVGSISADLWQWFNDAFPVNGYAADNVAAASAAFDTTTALVKGPLNTAPHTGDATRSDVLADSVVVAAPNALDGGTVRVDLVFRILPGPGNYRAIAGRTYPPTSAMTLLRVPTDQVNAATPGDASFWGQYMTTPGAYASPGAHHGGAWWDPLSWNSARCDTIETNIFPVAGRATSGVPGNGGFYQSTYHESDPHFATLGIAKGRCFMVDPTGIANSTNLSCDAAWNAAHLTWPLAVGTGFDGAWTTKEYTKIVPDGLLTPGSHVQYFFRKSRTDGTGGFAMVPDTTTISPQMDEGSIDGHRWQSFSVLPDRWKAAEFGGAGMACFLVLDYDDGRGDERVWVSLTDSLCMTRSENWGAANGWHAEGAGFGLDAASNPSIAQAFVHGRNRQSGTFWDLYNVRGITGNTLTGTRLGGRYATPPTGFMAGKGASIGPRKAWLRQFYSGLVWLAGDLNLNTIGPVADAGEDDIGVLEDFLATAGGTAQPRSLQVQGRDFAKEAYDDAGVQRGFLNNWLFADLRNDSYSSLVPGQVGCPDLTSSASIVPDGAVYGVANVCSSLNDVLTTVGAEGVAASWYEEVGVNGPFVAAVEHTPTPAHNWHSLLLGWDLKDTFSRWCGTSGGRLAYEYKVASALFLQQCASYVPCFTGDVPGGSGAAVVARHMSVGNSVLRAGSATVRFGVPAAGRVRVRVYDVTGRLVRTLADRAYEAGEQQAQWDGRDDAGGAVNRGVYFARLDYADGSSIKGRVIVLR